MLPLIIVLILVAAIIVALLENHKLRREEDQFLQDLDDAIHKTKRSLARERIDPRP